MCGHGVMNRKLISFSPYNAGSLIFCIIINEKVMSNRAFIIHTKLTHCFGILLLHKTSVFSLLVLAYVSYL